jgi:2-C-methyl-D-erythritol 4-phosphate cytidylyltransferase
LRYWLVMPAAGTGRRFGGDRPKQYATLAGRSVIEWALAPFLADPRCAGLCVALAPDDASFGALPVARDPRLRVAAGGDERAGSVLNGIAASGAADDDWILVHDAARPCLTEAARDALLDAVGTDPVGGLLAVPVVDTLKRAGAGDRVAATVARDGLWQAQTPQMFRRGVLERALRAVRDGGDDAPTDEAAAVERLGLAPKLVPGDRTNLKVTRPADLDEAAAILRRRQESAR